LERLIWAAAAPRQEVTHTVNDGTTFVAPDRVAVCFDDERAVADAGSCCRPRSRTVWGSRGSSTRRSIWARVRWRGERGRQDDDAGVRDGAGAHPFDVRRVRTLDVQGALLPSWELYPFITTRTDALEVVEAEHRQHAVVELCIRELKDQALAHLPSRRFFPNAAWTVIAALSHNLLRCTACSGSPAAPSASRAPYAAACSPSPAA
jgi:hypothetical protein